MMIDAESMEQFKPLLQREAFYDDSKPVVKLGGRDFRQLLRELRHVGSHRFFAHDNGM